MNYSLTDEESKSFNKVKHTLGRSHTKHISDILDVLPDAVCICAKNKLVYANKLFKKIFNINESIDVSTARGACTINGESFGDVFEWIRTEIMSKDTIHSYEKEIRISNKEVLYVKITVSPVVYDDIPSVLMVLKDISDYIKKINVIQYLESYDALTELPNRVSFIKHLVSEIEAASTSNTKFAVIFADLDRFKIFNDTIGHDLGDKIIKQAAQRLYALLPYTAYTARIGGDEFGIIYRFSEREDLRELLREINDSIKKSFALVENEINLSISIGVSIFPENGADCETLMKNAGIALYKAKDLGRDTYQLYDRVMSLNVENFMKYGSQLKKALDENEFFLVYQPKIDIVTKRIIGMEALLRWKCKKRGIVSPMEFIKLAEETGHIIPIGEWVLWNACMQNKKWQDQGTAQIRVSVNISARQLEQTNFYETVINVLSKTGLEPEYLELEITESTVINNFESANKLFEKLRSIGVRISMDDFGTGYSSLSYLKRISIDVLKLDKSFIHDIISCSEDRIIASTIIKMARELGIKVIAEGVENEAQLYFLKSNNCDHAQGYLFSKPLDACDFEKLIFSAGNVN